MTLPERVDGDGFDDIARSASWILGERIKFRKGRWSCGTDDMAGATLIAYQVRRRWEKWHDRELIDTIESVPGEPVPASVKEIEDGKADDSEWNLSFYVYLRDPVDARDYTYITSSYGGRRAVDALGAKTRNMRFKRPHALPVIRLDVRTYDSADYGIVAAPKLIVDSWAGLDGEPYDDKKNPPLPTPTALDDDIPF